MIQQLKSTVKTHFDYLESRLRDPIQHFDFTSRSDNQIIFDYGYNYFLLQSKLVKSGDLRMMRLRTFFLPNYPDLSNQQIVENGEIVIEKGKTRFRMFSIKVEDNGPLENDFSLRYLTRVYEWMDENLENMSEGLKMMKKENKPSQ